MAVKGLEEVAQRETQEGERESWAEVNRDRKLELYMGSTKKPASAF